MACIPAAPRLLGAAVAPAATENLTKHIFEDVSKAGAAEIKTTKTALAALLKRFVAETVISGTLLLVVQNGIGFVDFFEFGFSLLIPRIFIGVILHRHFAIGLFQRLAISVARNA